MHRMKKSHYASLNADKLWHATALIDFPGRKYFTVSWQSSNLGSPYTVVSNCINFSELVVRWMPKVPLEVNLLLPWQHLLDIWTYLKCLSITGKEFCTTFYFNFTFKFSLQNSLITGLMWTVWITMVGPLCMKQFWANP